MKRLEALRWLMRENFHYKKLAFRLNDTEISEAESFIRDHDSLKHLEFEYAVNRMFLDGRRGHVRPACQSMISELLVAANSYALGRAKDQ